MRKLWLVDGISADYEDSSPCHDFNGKTGKFYDLDFELLTCSKFSPDLAQATFFCSQILRECSLNLNDNLATLKS